MTLLELFWSFVQVGTFSFGGGYAALPLISDQVVKLHGWLTMSEFGDVVTISQMTPGPIAINAASFVGMRVGGLAGAVVATVGCVLPCVIITLLLGFAYYRYRKGRIVHSIMDFLRPAVVALIATAAISIIGEALFRGGVSAFGLGTLDLPALAIFAAALFVTLKWRPNQIFVILGSGAIGALVYLVLFPV